MPCTVLGSISYEESGFGERLVADLLNRFEAVQPFLRHDPWQNASWQAVLSELASRSYPRQLLAERLLAAATGRGSAPQVLAGLEALAQEGTFVVATGQQAGLLGGPLYTLHKALTAIQLARSLSLRFAPARFVPVFWVASDDHDLKEIDHLVFLDRQGTAQRVGLPLAERHPGASADMTRLSAEETLLLQEQLLKGWPEGPWGPLLEPYRAGSLGTACALLLDRWLGPLGLVVAESTLFRSFGGRLFRQELEEYPASCRLVAQAGQQLLAAGYRPGLAERPPRPQLFLDSDGLRVALEPGPGGEGFVERSTALAERGRLPRSYRSAELTALTDSVPERFSPAAALRPVLQNQVLPVAAAVLGPGEFAYWAQLAGLHDQYHTVFPVLVPRASVTLLDAAGEKALRRLNLTAADLLLPESQLRGRLFQGASLGRALEEGALRIKAELQALHRLVREQDRGLDPLFQKTAAQFDRELERLRVKTLASLAQREDAGGRHLANLMAWVRPFNQAQERILCMGPLLARFPELADTLLEQIEPLPREHRVVAFGGNWLP